MLTILAFGFGLCAYVSAAPQSEWTPLAIMDRYSNNTLVYDDFFNAFKQQGFAKFGQFDYVYGYYGKDTPVLIVFRPEPSSEELHGYYFPKGFESFSTYGGAEYEPVRKYFYSGQFESYTPYAAHFAYPYFYELKLTKFVHGSEFFPQFTVVFLVPKVDHPQDFWSSYKPIIASIPK